MIVLFDQSCEQYRQNDIAQGVIQRCASGRQRWSLCHPPRPDSTLTDDEEDHDHSGLTSANSFRNATQQLLPTLQICIDIDQ
ncbi:hypothetical protein RRG08_008240 [Elysia crispata]|uniref:Uncharacterized protein n=1 Tax=Elysia crispata TaxID=231223 RepID=A0AAE0YB86_9GAST|nr:hypothetical protein RRG08_008240 [Elysia crispata]